MTPAMTPNPFLDHTLQAIDNLAAAQENRTRREGVYGALRGFVVEMAPGQLDLTLQLIALCRVHPRCAAAHLRRRASEFAQLAALEAGSERAIALRDAAGLNADKCASLANALRIAAAEVEGH